MKERRRTLHRNLPLPIGHLLNDEDSEETEQKEVEDDRKKKPTPAPRRKMPPRKCKGDQTRAPPAHVRSNDQEEEDDHDSDDTESDRFNIIIRQRPRSRGEAASEPAATNEETGHQTEPSVAETSTEEETIPKDVEPPSDVKDEEERIEENEEEESSEEESEDTQPSPAPEPVQSRPVRTRKQPAWITSGDYVVGQQVVREDGWKQRLNALQVLSDRNPNVFQGIESKLGEAYLSILTSK